MTAQLARRDARGLVARYGPWAVVTGASDGIGRAMAFALARAGLDVVLVARRESLLTAIAGELEQSFGVRTRIVALDLGPDDGPAALVDATRDLDVGLMIPAAGFATSGPFVETPLTDELDMLAVNCRAVVHLAHAFGRRFVARGRGGLVLFSSIVAFQGVAHAAHYSATKAYVQTLAEALHVELRPHGVDVLATAPGPTASGFSARADMKMSRTVSAEVVAAQTIDALGRHMTVRPCFLSQALELALTLPRWGRVKVMQRVVAGMTRHQRAPD